MLHASVFRILILQTELDNQNNLNYHSVTPPVIINKVSFADSNSTFQTNNYIPLRLPIALTNLGNTC